MNGFIHHVDLTVRDLERAVRFYDQVMPLLGFRRRASASPVALFTGHGVEIGLAAARPESIREHDRYAPGLHHLAFGAPARDDVDRVHRELLRLGVTILDAPAEYPQYAPGYYAVFFADPDGMKLEYVFTPSPPGAAPASAG